MTLFTTPELTAKWDEWKKYRTSEKRLRKYTIAGEERAWKHLHELSNGIDEIAIKIINQSMINQYQGLFPLKTPYGHQPNSTSPKLGTSASRIEALKNW